MIVPFYEHNINLLDGLSTRQLNFPPHLHDRAELVRVKKGTLKMLINTQEYLVCAGDMAIVFPNVIHSFQTLSPKEDTQIETLVCGQDAGNGFPRKFIGSLLEEPVKPISSFHPDVDYLFSALLTELYTPSSAQIIQIYFQLMWLRLLPSLTINMSAQASPSDLTSKLIAYINEHYCESISLDSLSREFGVCRFYISHIFSQVLHVGFCDYVNSLRISQAEKLLRDSNYNIIDIAMQCGFSSQRTFNRSFKKVHNIAPSAYRKKMYSKTAGIL